jgi:hypothetical protein
MIFAAAALALMAGTAQAQKAGTYAGTSVDGGSISVTVTGTAGNFTLSNMNVNFQAACTHPARTANEGWGFFLGQAIVSGDNNYHSGNDYYDIRGALHFPSNNKIVGNITSVTAVFVPGDNPPIKAQFCKSAKQGFTLLFQTAPKQQLPTASVLEKRIGH